MVVCCLCGDAIQPNKSSMCITCLRAQVDITKGISKNETTYFCKSCGKHSIDGDRFVHAALESPELLALCLKGIHGLGKGKGAVAKLRDANWIWTEPHSRRLKINLEVEKEMDELNGLVVKQGLQVEFVVKTKMCPDCTKETTDQQWNTRVQLRQKVSHKKTLLALEQKLRAHQATKLALDVIPMKNGLDFYFAQKTEANKFTEAVLQMVPSRKKKESKSLKGADHKSNVFRFEYSIALEVSNVCKDDLLILPKRVNNSLFNGSSVIVICQQVTRSVHLINPFTLDEGIVKDSMVFDVQPMLSAKDMIPFTVLDVTEEVYDPQQQQSEAKHKLVEVEVARSSDLGNNDTRFFVKSHLGALLHAGDTVLGYDLETQNLPDAADELMKPMKGKELPSVVLVRKVKGLS